MGIGKAIGKRVDKSQRFQGSALDYNEKKTKFSNHGAWPLADANQIGVVKESITGFKPRVKPPKAKLPAADTVRPSVEETHPLGSMRCEGRKIFARCRRANAKCCKLQAVHGTNYSAMARDMRLNAMQHTASWLKKRIEKMIGEDEQEAAAATAAIGAGKLPPPPRLRKAHQAPKQRISEALNELQLSQMRYIERLARSLPSTKLNPHHRSFISAGTRRCTRLTDRLT